MADLEVEVVRSKKRKKTAQAYVTEGRLRVLIPDGLNPDTESKLITDLVTKTKRRLLSSRVDLVTRAKTLARRYRLPEPTSIEWSGRQMRRWGSCTVVEGRIRISDRLTSVPNWVLDWVVLHELAHLEVPDHGRRFQDIVSQYPLGERAEGYLTALSTMPSAISGGAPVTNPNRPRSDNP